jgi:hypothetical protein
MNWDRYGERWITEGRPMYTDLLHVLTDTAAGVVCVCVRRTRKRPRLCLAISPFFPSPFGSCLGQDFNTVLVLQSIHTCIWVWERWLCPSVPFAFTLFALSHSPKPNLQGCGHACIDCLWSMSFCLLGCLFIHWSTSNLNLPAKWR